MSKVTQLKRGRTAPELDTPTDLDDKAVAEISKALNGILADSFRALSQDQEFPLARQRPAFPQTTTCCSTNRPPRSSRTTDEIAERVRKIGGTTLRSIGHIAKAAVDQGQRRGVRAAGDMVRELMNDNKAVAAAMRKAHELCDEHEDVATASLLENLHRRDREADLVPVRVRARGGRDRATDAFPVRLRALTMSRARAACYPRPSCMKPSRDIARLIEIMAALRTPGSGCPWDLEQNFQTIAPYTIEEAYEVADAIDRGDLDDLQGRAGRPAAAGRLPRAHGRGARLVRVRRCGAGDQREADPPPPACVRRQGRHEHGRGQRPVGPDQGARKKAARARAGKGPALVDAWPRRRALRRLARTAGARARFEAAAEGQQGRLRLEQRAGGDR